MSIHTLPPSPPSSEGHASQPPVSPTSATQAAAPAKRSSRRANTAERRATHNAVERARRETLNGRFLDLAAMLPNLAAVRRPSKSAIVNSSIALIHAQRRQRAIAARELRLVKAENDALRQELNEWRARASLPRVEEPPRSTDLIALLNLEEDPDMGEEERRAYEMRDGSYEDGEDLAEDNDEGYGDMQQYAMYAQQAPVAIGQPQRIPAQGHQAHLAAQQQAVFAQQQAAIARANQLQMAANVHRPVPQQAAQPQIQVQTQMPFDAALFPELENNKFEAYGQMFSPSAPQNNQAQWNQSNAALMTPPGSGHGVKPSPFASTANQAFLTAYGQNGMFNPSFMAGNMSGSEDETSSIGSSHGHESTHFAGGSPDHSIGASPIEHQFAYNAGANGFVHPQQQRRPSINIPGQAFGSSKQASPYHQSASGASFAAMGLVM